MWGSDPAAMEPPGLWGVGWYASCHPTSKAHPASKSPTVLFVIVDYDTCAYSIQGQISVAGNGVSADDWNCLTSVTGSQCILKAERWYQGGISCPNASARGPHFAILKYE